MVQILGKEIEEGKMKAIKDCEWEVRIIKRKYFPGYVWRASTKHTLPTIEITTPYYENEIDNRKKSWLRFAQINKIKKWKYV